MRMLTARLWASRPSTAASCITALETLRKPSAVRFDEVMCFTKEPRLTPEYCFAYPYVAKKIVLVELLARKKKKRTTYAKNG